MKIKFNSEPGFCGKLYTYIVYKIMCYFATRVIFIQLMFWLYVILIVKPCAIYNFTYVNCPILKVHVHDPKAVSVIFLFIKTELLWPCWQCLDFGKETVNEYREIIEFLDYHYWIFCNHKKNPNFKRTATPTFLGQCDR